MKGGEFCMPAQWTAELLGEMHLRNVTAKQLAEETGWHPKYLSTVLNGHKEPKDAEKKLRAALTRIGIKRERAEKGLPTDLDLLVEEYRQIDPDYAAEFERSILLRPLLPSMAD